MWGRSLPPAWFLSDTVVPMFVQPWDLPLGNAEPWSLRLLPREAEFQWEGEACGSLSEGASVSLGTLPRAKPWHCHPGMGTSAL